MVSINLVFKNGNYIVNLSGETMCNTRNVNEVQEQITDEVNRAFLEAIRQACEISGMYEK